MVSPQYSAAHFSGCFYCAARKKNGKKKWRFDRSFSVKTFSVKMEVHISRIVYKDKLLSSSAFVAGTTCAQ